MFAKDGGSSYSGPHPTSVFASSVHLARLSQTDMLDHSPPLPPIQVIDYDNIFNPLSQKFSAVEHLTVPLNTRYVVAHLRSTMWSTAARSGAN
jgi:hypothetical protein